MVCWDFDSQDDLSFYVPTSIHTILNPMGKEAWNTLKRRK